MKAVWLVPIVLLSLARAASAHAIGPSLLELRETKTGTLLVRWKTPLQKMPAASPAPVLPASCGRRGEIVRGRTVDAAVEVWTADCGERGLVGAELAVDGLGATKAPVLLQVELADGHRHRRVLTAESPSFRVPEAESPVAVLRGYLTLGIRHIGFGLDHLLFVFALVLLVPRRRLLATVSAFTVGHSLTLSAAALGFVRFPTRPIEAAIAASILVLGLELTRDGATLTRRRPWLCAGGFGLLHGLGFAGALAEAGLPAGDVPLALFAFNSGIEIGQLAFVLAVLAAGRVLGAGVARLPSWTRLAPAYAVGCTSAFWLFERVLGG